MKWFSVHTDLADHPKTIRLADEIGEPLAHAYLVNLWGWATRYALDGTIRAESSTQLAAFVERAARWKGTPGVLYRALRSARYIDELEKPARRVLIHDWPTINGNRMEKAAKDAARKEIERKRRRAEANSTQESLLDVFSEDTEIRPELEPVHGTSRGPSAGRPSDVPGKTVTKLPMRAASHGPRPLAAVAGSKKPVVVAGRKRKTGKSFKPTTTSLPKGHSGRDRDRARDIFEDVCSRLAGKGRQHISGQLRSMLFPLRIDGDVLRLGVGDEFCQDWYIEHAELLLLETLDEMDLPLKPIVLVAERPAPPEIPDTWKLLDCLEWLEREVGLSMSPRPTDQNLGAFWDQAADLAPSAIVQAARAFRADEFWAKDNWAVYRFICDGVWKTRLPPRQAVERERARR